MRATKVNAGLAKSNGRLLLDIWRDSLHVTCGLTACTPGSAPGPTLGNEYGKTLLYFLTRRTHSPTACRRFLVYPVYPLLFFLFFIDVFVVRLVLAFAVYSADALRIIAVRIRQSRQLTGDLSRIVSKTATSSPRNTFVAAVRATPSDSLSVPCPHKAIKQRCDPSVCPSVCLFHVPMMREAQNRAFRVMVRA